MAPRRRTAGPRRRHEASSKGWATRRWRSWTSRSPPPEKLNELKQLLDQATDLELVARLVLGRYWRQATPEQQAEFVGLFKELVMQTMAERMSWYNGQTFEITGAKPVDERDTMVSTRILRPSGKPPILVDWRVRESGAASC